MTEQDDGNPPTSSPQLNFTLDNPGAPNTIYVSAQTSANHLTLTATPTVAASFTPGTLVQFSDAPAGDGSILFLDLTPLALDAAGFEALTLDLEGWESKPFIDTATKQMMLAVTPTESIPASTTPLGFALNGFALPTAPAGGPTTLDLYAFNVEGIVRGLMPVESGSPVAFAPPPGQKDDLHKALSVTLAPADVIVSDKGYPTVSNRLQLTLTQTGSVSIPADAKTIFRLSVVYATDPNGFGALLTAAQGEAISIPVPQGSGWTITDIEGTQGRSWQLVPPPGQSIFGDADTPISFALDPVVSTFQPGPTIALLSYANVPGFADGAFRVLITKQPHVRIDGPLKVDPPLSTLGADGLAHIRISWTAAHASRLMLAPIGGDVTGKTSFSGTIKTTTPVSLTAYGPGSGDADNMAIANATATVIPVLNAFYASPGAVSVDDFGHGGADVTLNWAVNVDKSEQLEITSSATGKISTRFGPTGSTLPSVNTPQMFTLDVVGDTRPEDQWRLYVPAFAVQVQEAAPSGGGGWPAAAPGASYVAVSQPGSNQLSILSTASYAQIATVPVGESPQGLAFSPDGTKIYVANTGDGTIGSVTVTTSSQTAPPWSFAAGAHYNVGGAPVQVALSPAGNVYASVGNGKAAGSAALINTTSGAVTTLPVGVDPYGIAMLPSGAQLFVANRGDGTVSQIGIAPGGGMQLIRTIAGLPGAAGLAVTPDGNVLLVACSDGTVQLLNATAPDTSAFTPVQIGGRPQDIALDPSGSYAFVTDASGARVSLVNIAKATVLGTPVTVAAGPTGVSVSPDGTLAFVGHGSGVSVLTLATYAARSNPPDCKGLVTDVIVTADDSSALIWADASQQFAHESPAPGLIVYTIASETTEYLLATTPIVDIAVPVTGGGAGLLIQTGQSAVYPLDLTTFALGTAIALPTRAGGVARKPRALAMSADGRTAFALVDNGAHSYSIVVLTADDGGTFTCTADIDAFSSSFSLLSYPLVATPDGAAVFAYDAANTNIVAVTNAAGGKWALDPRPLAAGGLVANGMAVSPNGQTVYLVSQGNNVTTFYLVDRPSWTVSSFTLSETPATVAINGLAITPDGTRLLASDQVAGAVRVIDSRSLRFLQTISWPQSLSGPAGLAVTNDQARIFVATAGGRLGAVAQVKPNVTEAL